MTKATLMRGGRHSQKKREAMGTDRLTIVIDRGSGRRDRFEVPAQDNQTVLDVVSWVQQFADPTLSYRFACRVGMCGSCAMTVNGTPRWTCRTHVSKVVKDGAIAIGPLRNLPVIKDLVVDLDPFFDKWDKARGQHRPSSTRSDEIPKVDATNTHRTEANAGIECINCAVCYAACDTVTNNPDYLGPAALQRAWTLLNDEKDADPGQILDAVTAEGGCQNCHSIGSCSALCPNELDPMSAISGLKREAAKAWFRGRR